MNKGFKKVIIVVIFGVMMIGSGVPVKAEVANVLFHIDQSIVGKTVFGSNVIIENVFDAVPSFGGRQS